MMTAEEWMVCVVSGLLMLGPASGCESKPRDVPEGRIAESSKTEACKQELLQALEVFKTNQGLDYEVRPVDVQDLFQSGHVEFSYTRDARKVACTFGIDSRNNACGLKFFRRSQREPGSTLVTTGDYGTVVLKQCQCN